MSDYEEVDLEEGAENMFGMSIKDDEEDDILGVDPLVDDTLLEEEEPLLEEDEVGPFLEDGDEEEAY